MAENKFDLFIKQSKFSNPTLQKAELKHVNVYKSKGLLVFHIELEDVVAPDVLLPFIEQLKTFFNISHVVSGIDVFITYRTIKSIEAFAIKYYEYAYHEIAKTKASFLVLKNFKTEFSDNQITLLIDKDSAYVKSYFSQMKKTLSKLGLNVDIDYKIDEKLVPTKTKIKQSINEQVKVLEQKEKIIHKEKKTAEKKYFSKKSRPKAVAISEIPLDQYQMDKYMNEKGDTSFLIEGTVSKKEVRKFTNTSLLTFVLGDEDDAITVKKFLNRPKDFDLASQIHDDDYIQVQGRAKFDTFQKDVVVFCEAIYFMDKVKSKLERVDKAKEKRIEFHLHTKMSNMDGIGDVSQYVAQAEKWGHEAIAFTDHNALYAYPDIYKYTKGKNIKPIYGVELDFVNETKFKITTDCDDDIALKDATFVVFDIETTGLSSTRDKIIEIGAVKMTQAGVIDTFQIFVNPEEPLSAFTTSLTGITDEMVSKAQTIDKVLPKFLAFANDSILVAHNALFDVGHIRENAKRLDLIFNHSKVVDTLSLARYFYSDQLKRFNLKAVAKYFKIKQENHHRADDDARVTADIWQSMMHDLSKQGIKHYAQINQAIDIKEAWKHGMPYHLNVLAQNQEGYKNLFKVVSDALTDHFYKGPRTLKSVLDKHRQGLLVGSGCANGDVFEAALNKGDEDLIEAISYYDYIEVQPPQAYKHLKRDLGQYADEIIEAIISKIIKTAKQQNKLVIATGDVHYLEKKDVLYREIYIRTPLVGGGIHQLNKYNQMPEQYFLTTDEMLQSFSFLDAELAHEIVVDNTKALNRLIEPIKAFSDELYSLPDDAFIEQLGITSISEEVERLINKKMHELYGEHPHPIVTKRVNRELKNIIENNFGPNYYVSHLLVKKSLEDGYLVGSRGSVGSSIVATLLDITEVNPLRPHYRCKNGDFTVFKLSDEEAIEYGMTPEESAFQPFFKGVQSGFDLPRQKCPICGEPLVKDGHDIPFETFLGFNGDKVPDIDLNFSGDYQSKAHDYVRELIGEDHTFRAGTIQTVAERNAFGYVKGYLEDKNLFKRPAQIERLAKKIEGVKRSTGQHPGGIVIVPKSKTIYDVTPVQYPANDTSSEWKTTHFDYHSFEANLLKLDILGHDDPTLIKFLMDYVEEHPEKFPFKKAQDIPLDDPRVYQLFTGTKIIGIDEDSVYGEVASYAIPEFGTSFTRQMLMDTKPDTFAGLVKISGLSHGTDVWLSNAQALINGSTEYGKISFNDIIACRDDIMVQLTQQGLLPLRAFEIMEFVRKGKPSKDPAKWLTYVKDMKTNNVEPWYIWSASQIKYMFPKAHATAYVIMAMRIAWFKIYQPLLFYSGFFSKRASQFDYELMVKGSNAIRNKLIEFDKEYRLKATEQSLQVTLGVALEMTKRGFKFLKVDINLSEATTFKMEEDGLRMPFSSIDGLGAAVAYDIIEKRKEKPFVHRDDVKQRTRINKTVFEKMEKYGAFDDLKSENNVITSGLFAL
jgi:DNA polymerase-3 subunit alpha (Gram-positive type)